MTTRDRIFRIFLWWGVLAMSLWVGGTFFNMVVIVPMWSASPPESVRSFFNGTEFNRTIWNFFGPPWMAIRFLPLLGALITGWPQKFHRTRLLITIACMTFGIVYTLAYIYPINATLFLKAGGAASADEIRSMVDDWVFADRIRYGIGVIGCIALLQAFSRPIATKTY